MTGNYTALLATVFGSLLVLGGCDRSGDDAESGDQTEETTETAEAQPSEQPSPKSKQASGDEEADRTEEGAKDEDTSSAPDRLWAGSTDEERVEIQLTGLDKDTEDEFGAAFENGEEGTKMVPYEPDTLPEQFHDLKTVDVLTPDGTVEVELEQITRTSGPDGYFYYLRTETSGQFDGQPEWLLVAPAGEMAESARFRTADPKPVHQKAVPKLRSTFLGGVDAEHRKKTQSKLEPDHITGVTGRFPAPHAQFVTVNVPPHDRGRGRVRAVYLAEDTGDVSETVDAPHVGGLGPVETLAVADPDGDAVDGVLFRVQVDGFFIRWLHFDADGNPVVDTLAGFSA